MASGIRNIRIRFTGDTKGLDAASRGGQKQLEGWRGSLERFRTRVAAVFRRAVKWVAAFAAAVLGLALKGGISRLMGIEDATKKLQSMGLATKDIDDLMAGLLESLKGTPFALDEGAGAMANLVSAGTPLKEVNRVFDLIADSAAFGQVPLNEVADIFTKIQTRGRLTAQEINMLQTRGVPAMRMLADAAGVTEEEMSKMISGGKVSAEEFFKLYEQGAEGFGKDNIKIAGAAKNAGDTTRGAWANMRAALSRFGATILKDIFPQIKDWLNNLGEWFDRTGEKVAPFASAVAEWIGKAASAMGSLFGWLIRNESVITPFVIGLGAAVVAFKAMMFIKTVTAAIAAFNLVLTLNPLGVVAVAIGVFVAALVLAWRNSETFRKVVTKVWNAVQSAVRSVVNWFTGTAWPAIKRVWDNIQNGASRVRDIVVGAFNRVRDGIRTVVSFVSDRIEWMRDKVTGAADRIKGALSGIWDGIKSGARAAVNGAIDLLNGAISALNKLINGANKVPGVNIPNIPNIPRLEKGGIARAGRTYLVGEAGPELFSPGSTGRVTPNHALGGDGITIHNLEVKAFSDSFRLRQVLDNLALEGAV